MIQLGDQIKVVKPGRHHGKIGIIKRLIGEVHPGMWLIKFKDEELVFRGDEIKKKHIE